ncbi:radical SAM protein [Rhodopseudomonas sp. BR0M22]|uniref:radical SAM protein n=1 Tax=Rhodopseudomonas sp. BR0M22 TaxID=2269369 RepID=UPI0019670B96|nr:radical SAM protein [Rhodopseudomonas sp. BR0M22]NEW91568.1 radical SAM protein [Rhodopseudomonas sp. BR0M22]
MVASVSQGQIMETRIRPGVRLREDVFGGICYVPQRDDFFAANQKIFLYLKSLPDTWTKVATTDKEAVTALAALGICETRSPKITEKAYCGPSFLGSFLELPSVSMPLVVNCFCTAHCPLSCIYCHADDLMKQFRDTESDDDIDNVAATANMLPAMVAVITGGDPLTRPRRAKALIERLAAEKALVLDTSGVGDITTLVPLLKENNVHVRVSLDTISNQNRKLRPTNRQYVKNGESSSLGAIRTIDICHAEGIPLTVQTVITSLNENADEWRDLRDWLVARGVRNWVIHVVVKGGAARRIEEASKGKRTTIVPSSYIYTKLWRLVDETIKRRLPIDIRCTDTDTTPNSVLLIGSKGDLYTEGYAHKGKVCLYRIGDARPDLIQALWPHLDRFGHARRYLNWNPWFFEGRSLETICYDVPVPETSELTTQANPVETEAKYPILDVATLEALLAEFGFQASGGAKFQRDEYFDTAERFAKRLDYVVRLRQEGGLLAVALKGPRHWVGRTYSRIELEVPAGSESAVRDSLHRSGFEATWYMEKRRTTYLTSRRSLVAAVDEIPELGFFLELEGPLSDVREMESKLVKVLGPQERRNYAELFRTYKLESGVHSEEIVGASFTS